MAFRAHILGAAAGGGLPQWNCGCDNCCLARSGDIPSMTQSSVAVSAGGAWAVLNASPDIRSQLAATPVLHPSGLREMPLASVVLTNGDIDHIAGLLTLREQQPFRLFATPEILRILDENPVFNALKREVVARVPVMLDVPFELVDGLEAELFAVPGKVPLYNEGEVVVTDLEGEQTVGVALRFDGGEAFYVPGCARMTEALAQRLSGAALVFFDGTLWSDDEMIAAGLSQKTGARMGHMSMSGPEGSMAAFEPLGVERRVYVHMNNSNPVLRPDSNERKAAVAAGWTIAHDGMEIVL